MKKLMMILVAGIWAFSLPALSQPVEAAAPVQVSSAGTLLVDIDGTGIQEAEAVEEAKERAVFKVLSHLTRPDNAPSSSFARTLANYGKYVRNAVLKKKFQVQGQVQVIMSVEVDVNRLANDLTERIAARQQDSDELLARIYIRVTGVDAPDQMDEKVMVSFNKHFAELGFGNEVKSPEGIKLMRASKQLSFPEYEGRIRQAILENVLTPTVAVIGEIRLVSVTPNPSGPGFYGRAEAAIESIDAIRNTTIGSFSRGYTILGSNPEAAAGLVIQKAAMDSGESMARQTLQYFRSLQGVQ